MKQRWITGLFLLAIVVAAMFLGANAMGLLLVVVAMLAGYEIFHLGKSNIKPLVLAEICIFLSLSIFATPNEMLVLIILHLIALVLFTIVLDWLTIYEVSYLFMLVTVVGLGLFSIYAIYVDFGPLALLWLGIANYGADMGAYQVGSAIGKRKLIERISPNKTIEGAIGGYLVGAVASLAFGLGLLGEMFSPQMIILISLLVPLTAQIGDLFFSLIKRTFKIKDFSSMLPGHGGILDRLDSFIFSMFVVTILLSLYLLT